MVETLEIHHSVPFTGSDCLRICDGSRFGRKPKSKKVLQKGREQ